MENHSLLGFGHSLPSYMEAGNLLLEAFMEAGVPTWRSERKKAIR
jgi:hypothetical protein